jgi:hypothetical protein
VHCIRGEGKSESGFESGFVGQNGIRLRREARTDGARCQAHRGENRLGRVFQVHALDHRVRLTLEGELIDDPLGSGIPYEEVRSRDVHPPLDVT